MVDVDVYVDVLTSIRVAIRRWEIATGLLARLELGLAKKGIEA
jgi:hypothetical protein